MPITFIKGMCRSFARSHPRSGPAGLATGVLRRLAWLARGLDRDLKWRLGGLAVRLLGNKTTVEGCRFDLHHSLITDRTRTQLLLGRYEEAERQAMAAFLPKDLPVVELGGSIGVVSCLANTRLVRPSEHVVVEADPRLIGILETNRSLNRCEFTIVNRALGYGAREVCLYSRGDSQVGSAHRPEAGSTSVVVQTITLEDVVREADFPRFSLICDIEGEEINLIRNEVSVLTASVAVLILEEHLETSGFKVIEDMKNRLMSGGFELAAQYDHVTVWRNRALSASNGHSYPSRSA